MTEKSKKILSELDPMAIPRFNEFIKKLDKELGDDKYIIFEGLRKIEVQEAYYAQGREPVEKVNKLRKKAGLWLLRTHDDNGNLINHKIITWTLQSKHIDGFAMDVLPVDGSGNPTWDLAHYYNYFKIIRDCGRAVGLICGASWNPPDWPHYEI